MTYNFNLMY